MLISASVVGSLALYPWRKWVNFSNRTAILHLYLLICKHSMLPSGGWCWHEQDWVLISRLSLTPAVVPALKCGVTSLCLSFLMKHLAYITRMLQPVDIIAGAVSWKKSLNLINSICASKMHSRNHTTELLPVNRDQLLWIETTLTEVQKESTDFGEKPSCVLWDKAIHLPLLELMQSFQWGERKQFH